MFRANDKHSNHFDPCLAGLNAESGFPRQLVLFPYLLRDVFGARLAIHEITNSMR